MNWNLQYLASLSPKIKFIYLHRDTIDNASSLLSARRKFFGNIESWYSFKPPQWQELKQLDPYEQVLWQVDLTNQSIRSQLFEIEQNRSIEISFENLVAIEDKTISSLAHFVGVSRETLRSLIRDSRDYSPKQNNNADHEILRETAASIGL